MQITVHVSWPNAIITTAVLSAPNQPFFAPVLKTQIESCGSLRAPEAASLVNLSPSRFSHSFSEAFCFNFRDSALFCRMALAAHYLNSHSIRVSEIAERLHYSDIKTFERAFQGIFGHSPTEFRRDRCPRISDEKLPLWIVTDRRDI